METEQPVIANTTFLSRVDSTNRYVKENFQSLPDRHTVIAELQTSGRGRLTRSWHSPPGNLYMTLALQVDTVAGSAPQEIPRGVPNLTQYMAVALTRVLDGYGVIATIKWPNDVQIAGRKIAGILAEGVVLQDRLAGVALGCGVNLNMSSDETLTIDQPATALNLEIGGPVERLEFVQDLLRVFLGGYEHFMGTGFEKIREEFKQKCPFLGKDISIVSVNSRVVGLARDITMDGALLVETREGAITEITLGDVQW